MSWLHKIQGCNKSIHIRKLHHPLYNAKTLKIVYVCVQVQYKYNKITFCFVLYTPVLVSAVMLHSFRVFEIKEPCKYKSRMLIKLY